MTAQDGYLAAISRVCYSNWKVLDLEVFAANSFPKEQNRQNLQQSWWAKYTTNLFGWDFMSTSLYVNTILICLLVLAIT